MQLKSQMEICGSSRLGFWCGNPVLIGTFFMSNCSHTPILKPARCFYQVFKLTYLHIWRQPSCILTWHSSSQHKPSLHKDIATHQIGSWYLTSYSSYHTHSMHGLMDGISNYRYPSTPRWGTTKDPIMQSCSYVITLILCWNISIIKGVVSSKMKGKSLGLTDDDVAFLATRSQLVWISTWNLEPSHKQHNEVTELHLLAQTFWHLFDILINNKDDTEVKMWIYFSVTEN